jgi:hypothetical protein
MGTKFIFLEFLTKMIKNDKIYIKMVKFIFKRTNQELTTCYRLIQPGPIATSSGAGGTAQPLEPAPEKLLQR